MTKSNSLVFILTIWIAPISSFSFLFHIFNLPLNLLNFARLSLICSLIFVISFEKNKFPKMIRKTHYVPLLFLYMVFSLTSTLSFYLPGLSKWFGLLLAFWLIDFSIKRMNVCDIAKICKNTAILGFIFLVIFFLKIDFNSLFKSSIFLNQKMGILDNVNANAVGSVCTCVIIISLFIRNKFVKSLIISITFIFLLLTLSRTSIITTLFCLLFYVWFLRYRFKSKINFFLIGVLILSTILVFAVFGEKIETVSRIILFRTEQIDNLDANQVFAGRPELWKVGIKIWLKQPIIGYGIASSPFKYNQLLNYGSPHNGYLAMLMESGIIGFICVISLVITSLINLYKRYLEMKSTPTNVEFEYYVILIVINIGLLIRACTEAGFLNPTNLFGIVFLFQLLWNNSSLINKSTSIN